MSNLREAAQQALEALEAVYGDSCDAIHELRAALAQPEPEWVLSQNELPPPYVAREPIAQPEPAAPSEDRPLFDPEYPDSGYCTNAEWAARKSAQAAASTVVEPLIGCVGHDCADCQARAATPPQVHTVEEPVLLQCTTCGTVYAEGVPPQVPAQKPVAWRTFDGEGGYDYRSHEGNENYRDEYLTRNGDKYASWVEPLYLATPPRAALTDEQIHDCFQQKHKDKATERRMITRAVEAAHNIGGPRNE